MSAFNENLAEQVDIWKDEVPDATIMLFDLEKYWRLLLAYPEMFGLTDCSRYSALFGTARPNMGRMGFWYALVLSRSIKPLTRAVIMTINTSAGPPPSE